MPLLDMSEALNVSDMFNYCSNLEEVPQFDLGKVTSSARMFRFCTKLKNVPAFNLASVTSTMNIDSMYAGCNALTSDSLNNVLATILTLPSNVGGTKTLRYLGLSSTQANTCTGLSNWSSVSALGWTTGY